MDELLTKVKQNLILEHTADDTVLLQASMDAKDVRTPNGILKNLVVIIANKVNDIPAWFYLDNPNVKNIMLRTPSKEEREQLVKSVRFPSFFANDIYVEESPYYQEHPEELEKIQDKFVGMTEGFSFTELNGLRRLAKNQRIHIRNLCDVVDLYKFGIKENPWNSIDREKIKNDYFPDTLILTSDGIHDFVDIDFMENALSSNDSDSDAARTIVEEARKNGSTDDTTIIILRR